MSYWFYNIYRFNILVFQLKTDLYAISSELLMLSCLQDSPVNLNTLAKDLSQHILNREFFETRPGYEEDDALIGLLNVAAAVFKHNPTYKNTDECRVGRGICPW